MQYVGGFDSIQRTIKGDIIFESMDKNKKCSSYVVGAPFDYIIRGTKQI